MLQTAIEAEVEEFLCPARRTAGASGNRLVVRNGYQPAARLLTGAGRLEVQQPRVRDNSPRKEKRVQFSSAILPPYLRRSKAIDELIPWLYLKGISTGDFSEALQSLLGEEAPGLSPNVIVRLKEQWDQEYEAWNRRDLSEQALRLRLGGRHSRQRSPGRQGKSAAMPAGLHGCHGGRPEGTGRGHGWLPRERAELV